MSKMTNVVKTNKQMSNRTVNYMGGLNFKLNPLDTLKIVATSSIFGEPAYYRDGEFAAKTGEKFVYDLGYDYNKIFQSYHTVLDKSNNREKTSDIMEKAIDAALDYDYKGTLEFAVELRTDYLMRLNPQIIMVRAAMHKNRTQFTKDYPGLFGKINNKVMSRMDEPASQLTYYLYRNTNKSKLPTILKKNWAKKIECANRYQICKYKNAGLGLIDVVNICHASGKKNPLINELMNGTLKQDENDVTWQTLKSAGKTWIEILEVSDIFTNQWTVKIGHMALLRNLRGIFTETNDSNFGIEKVNKVLEFLVSGVINGKQFPFRYYTAKQIIENSNCNYKPLILDALNKCLDYSLNNMPKLKGRTMCLSDNSGSAWGTFNSEYGSVTIADIGNLSATITAKNSDEGYVGVFGDELKVIPIMKSDSTLTNHEKVTKEGSEVGYATENGIWLFFKQAIENKEHWDNIFIYSDQQASTGTLYGLNSNSYKNYSVYGKYVDVLKLINEYRKINPKVNVYTIQTAGYNNAVIPTNLYRTSVLSGWTGKELIYADKINKLWDQIDNK